MLNDKKNFKKIEVECRKITIILEDRKITVKAEDRKITLKTGR